MYTNVNLAAPIGVMLFLGTAFVVALTALIFVISLLVRKSFLTRLSTGMMAGVLAIYFGLLCIFSLASTTHSLARGEEKHFCEIDCHLAYSIADVRRTDTLALTSKSLRAQGIFYVVTIKTRFDETTIGPRRGDGPLSPNPRSIALIDSSGHRFEPAADAQTLITQNGLAGTPIETSLRPGESYTTVFVFDLPRDAPSPALLITESDPVTRFIIGHENSFAHKRTVLQL